MNDNTRDLLIVLCVAMDTFLFGLAIGHFWT